MRRFMKSFGGTILFLLTDTGDYFTNEKWPGWNEVDSERTPYPAYGFPEISEQEALELAKKFGMSQEEFYK